MYGFYDNGVITTVVCQFFMYLLDHTQLLFYISFETNQQLIYKNILMI